MGQSMTVSGFGERLRRVRESHGATLEEVARRTEVDIGYLRALECGDIDALPGPAFGKFYIRAYADALGFDPRTLIDAYDVARRPPRRAAGDESRVKGRRARWDQPRPRSEPSDRPAPEARPRAEPPAAPTEAEASEPAAPVVEPAAEAPPSAGADALPAAGDRAVPTSAAATSAGPTRSRIPGRVAIAAAVTLAVLAFGYLAIHQFAGEGTEAGGGPVAASVVSTAEQTPDTPPAPASAHPAVGESGSRAGAVPSPGTAAQPGPPPGAAEPSEGSALRVSEYGVGRRIVGHRLDGRGDRFEEGTVVWFSTRVLGGRKGEKIHHVWLHGRGVVQTIELELGGPHWRTHSSKTLWGRGRWAVEARDSAGRVLARAEFTCEASS